MTEGRNPAQSDSPPPDLKKERDELLQNFTRNARITEQFVREYETMLDRLQQLESENASLRAKVEADDAIRELLKKIEELELERRNCSLATSEPRRYPVS